MDVKFQAIPERIEFRGISRYIRVFQGLNWFWVGLFRRSELKTILPFILALQAQIIPGEMDIFSGLFPRGICTVCQFSKGTLKI